ncbi:MAG TPA: carboxyltransferase domain-containing protein [Actinomycetota bacterium]|nr:carboxyltransferase domain-containing protein [Actinomycetota bacterium]
MRVQRFGDRGLRIVFDEEPSKELTLKLRSLCKEARSLEGVIDAAPGQVSAALLLDGDPDLVERALGKLSVEPEPLASASHIVQVIYDGVDLEWIAHNKSITVDDIVALHAGREYFVRMLGSPGFIYLSDVHPTLQVERLATPRPQVPAGSIGVAGLQTGIYGRGRPGGWRIVGKANEVPEVAPGDTVRFAAVTQ